jgi:hypothetical protein
MIRYLKRNQLDIKKYDACISIAVQSKVYAFSWYLDCVLENWDTLVLDDYVAVMPLPKAKKYGITYVFQPFWIQHLGVFSGSPLSDAQMADFINNVPKKFRLIDFNINFKLENSEEHLNYILPLGDDYKTLFKNFSKGRKSSITQAEKFGLTLQESKDYEPIIKLFKQNRGLNIEVTETAYSKLERLLLKANELNQLKIIEAYSKSNQLIGGAFFILSKHRITYLFSAINQEGRDLQAMSLIINSIIKEYSETEYVLDFEGSMLPGVAKFIRSFGAQKELYYHYKKWRLF